MTPDNLSDLVTLSHRRANKAIRDLVQEPKPQADDLAYAATFLQTRERDAATNDWRVGMAALYIAIAGLGIAATSALSSGANPATTNPFVIYLLYTAAGGVLLTLVLMVVGSVAQSRRTQLLLSVNHALELARRRESSAPGLRDLLRGVTCHLVGR